MIISQPAVYGSPGMISYTGWIRCYNNIDHGIRAGKVPQAGIRSIRDGSAVSDLMVLIRVTRAGQA